METIFLALSGLIVVAGILYWFWSHLQLTQKKVQLLENAVFELRGMLASSGGGSAGPPQSSSDSLTPATDTPMPAATYTDLADDGWDDEDSGAGEVVPKSTPLDLPAATATATQITREVELNIDELAPGGRIQIGEEKEASANPDEFRELFIPGAGEAASSRSNAGETLEGMPVRELRRLAEQRGIRGVADMKKKELLAALRQQVVVPPAPVELSIVRDEGEVVATDAEILE